MEYVPITAVGIDVSKGKSTVAVRRPGGEVLYKPFNVNHTLPELDGLVKILHEIGGEIRIVMEHTGMYWRPIAHVLKSAGFFVSIVNAMLIHDFSDNSIRKVKTDRADALKIASYTLTFWSDLRDYSPEDENRQMLKTQSRLYERTQGTGVMLRNGLIALLDQVFPGANHFFTSPARESNGHVKWVDFIKRFWHKDCIAELSFEAFIETYQRWCKREGYKFYLNNAKKIYSTAKNVIATYPKNKSTKLMITQAVHSLNAIYDSLHILRAEMLHLASFLPEFQLVMSMQGMGPITGPQFMAEIGDVRRFKHKRALVAFAGVDAPPYQSGTFDSKSRRMSKRGSPHLRRTLFQVCRIILQHADYENPIFRFMDKKRAEGKPYFVYMVAACGKLLRIYYARVKEYYASD